MKVKIINLNTWHGGKFLWDTMVEYINAEKPDILFLQECYASLEPRMPKYLTTVASLQAECNFPYAEYEANFVLRTDDDQAPIGNAILSKFPLTNKHVYWYQGDGLVLADNNDRDKIPSLPRALLHCQTTIDHVEYNLVCNQGVWGKDANETDLQKKANWKIHEYLKGRHNLIVAGDFNVNEGGESVELLEKDLVNIFKGERTSSFNMNQKTNPGYATAVVDFIFLSPSIEVLEHYTADWEVSDHQSQVAILSLGEAAKSAPISNESSIPEWI